MKTSVEIQTSEKFESTLKDATKKYFCLIHEVKSKIFTRCSTPPPPPHSQINSNNIVPGYISSLLSSLLKANLSRNYIYLENTGKRHGVNLLHSQFMQNTRSFYNAKHIYPQCIIVQQIAAVFHFSYEYRRLYAPRTNGTNILVERM